MDEKSKEMFDELKKQIDALRKYAHNSPAGK